MGELSFYESLPPTVSSSWFVVNATRVSVGSNATASPFSEGLKTIVTTGASFLLLPQMYVDMCYRSAHFVANDPYQYHTFLCIETLSDLRLQNEFYESTIRGS